MTRRQSGYDGTPLKLRTNAPRQTEEQGRTTRYRLPMIAQEEENPDAWTVAKPHTSARRYVDTQGNTVIERGSKRLVIHDEPPPRQRRRPHWTVIAIISGAVVLLLFAFVVWATNKWNDTQNDWTYTATFRTFSIDYRVGHNGDIQRKPSHFIVQNDHANIVIIEFPADNPGKVIVYYGPALLGEGQDRTPVTISFQPDPQTGRIDLILHVEGQGYIFTNNGTKFVAPAGQ